MQKNDNMELQQNMTGSAPSEQAMDGGADMVLQDLSLEDVSGEFLVPEPADRSSSIRLMATTPARLGIWRCGPRYLTRPYLRFRADHAAAQDAVFREVAEDFLSDWGLPAIKSRCSDREQFLTRPDLGRRIDDDGMTTLREQCQPGPHVQVFVADGLSALAVETNARDTFLAIEQGLLGSNITLGIPFFLRFGRVRAMEDVARALQPEVTAVLIGERPGLASAESMSCYLAYRITSKMPESAMTVISNIHRRGTPSVEAGAYIAEVIGKMLEQQASGITLQL